MDEHTGEPITIVVNLKDRDMVVGQRALFRHPEPRRARRFVTAASAVLAVGVAGLGAAAGRFGPLVAGAVLVAHAVLWQRFNRAWRKLHEGRPSSVTIDELGYTSTTAGIVSRVPWTALIDIESGSEHIVMRVAPGQPDVWPRRCFAPGDDERALAWARHARQ